MFIRIHGPLNPKAPIVSLIVALKAVNAWTLGIICLVDLAESRSSDVSLRIKSVHVVEGLGLLRFTRKVQVPSRSIYSPKY